MDVHIIKKKHTFFQCIEIAEIFPMNIQRLVDFAHV